MNKKNMAWGGVLIVIIAITCLIFFGLNTNPKDEISVSAFSLVIFTEVLLCASMLVVPSKDDKTGVTGIKAVTSIYAVISLILNGLCSSLFTSLRVYLIINIIILLIYLMIILMDVMSKKD